MLEYCIITVMIGIPIMIGVGYVVGAISRTKEIRAYKEGFNEFKEKIKSRNEELADCKKEIRELEKKIKGYEPLLWHNRFHQAVYIEDSDVERDVMEFIEKERKDLTITIKNEILGPERHHPDVPGHAQNMMWVEEAIKEALKK